MTIGLENKVVIHRNTGLGDIARYRLPWVGKVSISHCVSGTLMFLLLPLVLYLFGQSLMLEISFAKLTTLLSNGSAKTVVLVFIWAYLHHFCAGIRYLILGLYIGINKTSASRSVVNALIVSLLLIVVSGAELSGLF